MRGVHRPATRTQARLREVRDFDRYFRAAQSRDKEVFASNINKAARVAARIEASSGVAAIAEYLLEMSNKEHDDCRKETLIYVIDSIMRHAQASGDMQIVDEYDRHVGKLLKVFLKSALRRESTRYIVAEKIALNILPKWQAKNWFEAHIENLFNLLYKMHGKLRAVLERRDTEDDGRQPDEDFADADDAGFQLGTLTPAGNLTPVGTPFGGGIRTPVAQSLSVFGATAKAGCPATPCQPRFLSDGTTTPVMPGTPTIGARTPVVRGMSTPCSTSGLVTPKAPIRGSTEVLKRVPQTPSAIMNQMPGTPRPCPGTPMLPNFPGTPAIGRGAAPSTPAAGTRTPAEGGQRKIPSTPGLERPGPPTKIPSTPGRSSGTPAAVPIAPSTPANKQQLIPSTPAAAFSLATGAPTHVPSTPAAAFAGPRVPSTPSGAATGPRVPSTPSGATAPSQARRVPSTPVDAGKPAQAVQSGAGGAVPSTPAELRRVPSTPAETSRPTPAAGAQTPGRIPSTPADVKGPAGVPGPQTPGVMPFTPAARQPFTPAAIPQTPAAALSGSQTPGNPNFAVAGGKAAPMTPASPAGLPASSTPFRLGSQTPGNPNFSVAGGRGVPMTPASPAVGLPAASTPNVLGGSQTPGNPNYCVAGGRAMPMTPASPGVPAAMTPYRPTAGGNAMPVTPAWLGGEGAPQTPGAPAVALPQTPGAPAVAPPRTPAALAAAPPQTPAGMPPPPRTPAAPALPRTPAVNLPYTPGGASATPGTPGEFKPVEGGEAMPMTPAYPGGGAQTEPPNKKQRTE